MAKTKSELAMGDAVGQHRRDEPNLDATPPRQNDLHSSAVRFVAAPVESWSNTLSSSCDPGSSACIVEGVVDWITRNEKRGIKSSGTGVFLVPGFAKFVVIKKPATKERRGTNPFTKEPMTFKAKPARKIVRARPVKAAKDAV
jgi:nucleoid DNA-binding protein